MNVLEANVTLSLLERELLAGRVLRVDVGNGIEELDDVGRSSLSTGHVRDVGEDVAGLDRAENNLCETREVRKGRTRRKEETNRDHGDEEGADGEAGVDHLMSTVPAASGEKGC